MRLASANAEQEMENNMMTAVENPTRTQYAVHYKTVRVMHSYGTNVPLYPELQAFFRKYQPPTLIVWGKNDFIFPAAGAPPYKRDLKNVETHMLDTGHFALETHGEEIAGCGGLRRRAGYVIKLEAFDWNCQQHITPRFTAEQIQQALAPFEQRLELLERENEALRQTAS